jgi:hypothetical protein
MASRHDRRVQARAAGGAIWGREATGGAPGRKVKAVSRANVEHVLNVSFGIAVRLLIRWQNWLAGAALVFLVLVGLRLWPHQPLRAWKPTSLAITDARGRLLRLVLASDDRYRLWLPLSQMPTWKSARPGD